LRKIAERYGARRVLMYRDEILIHTIGGFWIIMGDASGNRFTDLQQVERYVDNQEKEKAT
jgi:hypothetical protein